MTEDELISRYGKEKVEQWKEAFSKATIQNDFVFCKVAGMLRNCKEILCRILGYMIEIKKITPQASIDNFLHSKAVRLDILVEDESGNNYDIEMQVVVNDSIPKRMRIYQASIDSATFAKGKKYKDAKKTIIIFICMTCPIGLGLPVYTFKNLCVENPNIELGDDTLKVIVSPQNWERCKDERLKALLRYIWDGSKLDEFTKELDMCVVDIKCDQVIRGESLSYYCELEDAEDRGVERGRAEGRVEGRAEGICETARNMRAKSFDISLISEVTGLTIEEIEKL